MTTSIKTEFKQWQVLPDLSRLPADGTTVTSLPECRSESAGPSLAKPGRAGCFAKPDRTGESHVTGNPPEKGSGIPSTT